MDRSIIYMQKYYICAEVYICNIYYVHVYICSSTKIFSGKEELRTRKGLVSTRLITAIAIERTILYNIWLIRGHLLSEPQQASLHAMQSYYRPKLKNLPTHHVKSHPSSESVRSLPPPGFFCFIFLAASGLCCCVQVFTSCSEQGLLFAAVPGLLIAVASLVVEHRF